MNIIGFLAAIIIGFTLGLMGGGGSILTVPVLVYLLGFSPIASTAYSLFIVGSVALVGAFDNIRKRLVSFKTAIIFAIPSFIAVYLTRRYLVPAIPENLFTLGDFLMTKDTAIMLFFSFIMLLASVSMIRSSKRAIKSKEKEPKEEEMPLKFNYPLIFVDGAIVGIVTGTIGAGGGFLIIPALVLLARLPMKLAVGTSLMIIAVKSLFGFVGDIRSGQAIDWSFLLTFSALAVIGIFLGGFVSNFIAGKKLKVIFGWFVLFMSIFILIKELFL